MPRVSVIVPAHDAADTIEETLASALSQTERDLEVVVVDDGSADDTATVVERIAHRDRRVRLIRRAAAGGVAVARNVAIERASGALIAPLDADDVWAPTKIERQLARLAGAPSRVGLVYSWSIVVDESGRPLLRAPAWREEGYVLPKLATFHFIGSASCPLIPRRVFDEVGGYDAQLRAEQAQGCEDWDLALRIAERFEFALAPGYLVGYRRRAGSMSSDVSGMWRSYERVMSRLAQAHPELPEPLRRWSRSQFQRYLAALSVDCGDSRHALRWVGRSIRADPSLLLSGVAMAHLLEVSTRALVDPLLAPRGTRRRAWLGLAAAPYRAARHGRLEEERPLPWNDAPWSLHARVCRARWRIAERHARRRDLGSPAPIGAGAAPGEP